MRIFSTGEVIALLENQFAQKQAYKDVIKDFARKNIWCIGFAACTNKTQTKRGPGLQHYFYWILTPPEVPFMVWDASKLHRMIGIKHTRGL